MIDADGEGSADSDTDFDENCLLKEMDKVQQVPHLH